MQLLLKGMEKSFGTQLQATFLLLTCIVLGSTVILLKGQDCHQQSGVYIMPYEIVA